MEENCICALDGMGTNPYCPACYAVDLIEIYDDGTTVTWGPQEGLRPEIRTKPNNNF